MSVLFSALYANTGACHYDLVLLAQRAWNETRVGARFRQRIGLRREAFQLDEVAGGTGNHSSGNFTTLPGNGSSRIWNGGEYRQDVHVLLLHAVRYDTLSLESLLRLIPGTGMSFRAF